MSTHVSNYPPVVPIDPGRYHTGAVHDGFNTIGLPRVVDKRDIEVDDRSVLGRGREPRALAHIRQEIAESECNPDAVDSLDWLQHVRMVAKNQIHGAARGHRLSNSSLLCAGLAVILDAPMKTE
ncbi:MAG: hypothetical protein P8L16_03510, partial [Ilumatobacter sp.]|nr:hypothetical protein [Ilumatobacter sp.]